MLRRLGREAHEPRAGGGGGRGDPRARGVVVRNGGMQRLCQPSPKLVTHHKRRQEFLPAFNFLVRRNSPSGRKEPASDMTL